MLIMPFNVEESKLVETIETLREEMIKIGLQEGLASPKTIEASQKLDRFIAKYHSIYYALKS